MTKSKFLISNSREKPKGYVLISTLVIMMIMLVITYYLADVLFSEIAISRNQKNSMITFNIAEAGTQQALWRIQNHATTRTAFQTGTSTSPPITFTSSLLTNSTYTVSIQNSAPGAATITTTGLLNMGLKQAQRKITLKVFQTPTPGTYNYDAALLAGGANGNINLNQSSLNVTGGGSLASGGNINKVNQSTVNVAKDILANGPNIITNQSTIAQGGIRQTNYSPAFVLPGIDINSDASTSYKSQAIAQGHYYTSTQFKNILKTQTTFDGITYVSGSGGVTINQKNNIIFNGALVSEGSITINQSTVNVYHNPAPSGILTLGNLSTNQSTVNIEGLVYISVSAATSNQSSITIKGALLTSNFSANQCQTFNIEFNKDWVNEVLTGGGNTGTPMITFDHWEEEY